MRGRARVDRVQSIRGVASGVLLVSSLLPSCAREEGSCASGPSSDRMAAGGTETVDVEFSEDGQPDFLDVHGFWWSLEGLVPADVVPAGGGEVEVDVTLVADPDPDRLGDEVVDVRFPTGEDVRLRGDMHHIGCD